MDYKYLKIEQEIKFYLKGSYGTQAKTTIIHYIRMLIFRMNSLSKYKITFSGLKEGIHNFKFEIDNQFFLLFDYKEFNSCKILVDVEFTKKTNLLELLIKSRGIINLDCHVSDESFNFEHSSDCKMVVKFGQKLNNEDYELLIVPNGTYEINLSQQLYEMIVLSLPLKVIHPGIIDGTLNSKVLERLKDYHLNKTNTSSTDPRWDKLKELK